MSIAKEEIFGPVQSILKFTDLEEVNLGCNYIPLDCQHDKI